MQTCDRRSIAQLPTNISAYHLGNIQTNAKKIAIYTQHKIWHGEEFALIKKIQKQAAESIQEDIAIQEAQQFRVNG